MALAMADRSPTRVLQCFERASAKLRCWAAADSVWDSIIQKNTGGPQLLGHCKH